MAPRMSVKKESYQRVFLRRSVRHAPRAHTVIRPMYSSTPLSPVLTPGFSGYSGFSGFSGWPGFSGCSGR